MTEFANKIAIHSKHVETVGHHCNTEETTKQALILPLLEILGFSPYDPTKVKAEYAADFPGAKAGERVDYALFSNGVPVMFIEAKPYVANLNNHCPQLSRYFNATPEVSVGIITNGKEWRFFTDLENKNIMDSTPFLVVEFGADAKPTPDTLAQFHHDQFQPQTLRALAEENIYLNTFTQVLKKMFTECDADLVKYVANRAGVQKTFTARFVESVQPILKQAIAKAISEMLTSSLNVPVVKAEPTLAPAVPEPNNGDVIDPENSRVVTTEKERRIHLICQELAPNEDLQSKDNESYFNVLWGSRSNRWVLRYWSTKKRPTISFCMPLTEQHRAEIKRAKLEMTGTDSVILDRPEDLYRLAGMLQDALTFAKNDENFKRI